MIICGEAFKEVSKIESNSIDAVVTDPPYGLSFMGKKWDYDVPDQKIWEECLRVLKPGGYLLAFAGTRTQHRMAVRIEDAGFEIRDMIAWVYGSGFPKSLNIGKAVDKLQGNEREVGVERSGAVNPRGFKTDGKSQSGGAFKSKFIETKGSSEWEGWGTALKPALEPITVARKPLEEKTVAENVLKYGTGGINIDESRVGTEDSLGRKNNVSPYGNGRTWSVSNTPPQDNTDNPPPGRFPANLIHDNSEEVRECFPETKSTPRTATMGGTGGVGVNTSFQRGSEISNFNDSGNASRFFKSIIYQAKASKSDRGVGNNHPTVKPIALMEYLIKMVSREGATILDPFMGSGSTGIAAKNLKREFIGIEMEKEYCDIAAARIHGIIE